MARLPSKEQKSALNTKLDTKTKLWISVFLYIIVVPNIKAKLNVNPVAYRIHLRDTCLLKCKSKLNIKYFRTGVAGNGNCSAIRI